MLVKIILIGFLILTSGVNAQNSLADIPAVSTGEIQFYVDHTAFAGKEDKSFVEFYLMLFADQLDIKDQNGNKISEFNVTTRLQDSYLNDISKREWTTEAAVSNGEESITDVIYDLWSENLKPGEYKIKITVKDINSNRKGEAVYSFKIDKPSDKFSSSNLQFATNIVTSDADNHFRKGNKVITPNPSRRFGLLNPILYFYYELYNVPVDENEKLKVNYSIIGKSGETVKTFPQVEISKDKFSAGVTHGLNAANIPSGIYDFKVEIIDPASNNKIITTRRFEIIQKDYANLKPQFTTEDSEKFEKVLSIIGTDSQLRNYRNLSEGARAEYMVQFWRSVDPTPGTSENEYLLKIQQRFLYAEQNFGWGNTEGWKSERGRVLIKYGMPDEIELHNSEPDSRPYEIWKYKEEKSFIFVFGDLQSNGRYVLLHSDKEGEVSNIRWPEYIRRL